MGVYYCQSGDYHNALRESYPLVNVYMAMENHHATYGKHHYKLPCSIAIC